MEAWYLAAFNTLSSERPVGFSLGEIPWSAKVRFAEYHGLDKEVCDILIFVTAELDKTYLTWHEEQQKKTSDK